MAHLSAFAIILDDDNRVLLSHRRDADLWNLPGGRVESTESPWEAVVREVREETGLVVQVTRLTGIYFKPAQDETSFAFECVIVAGSLEVTDEADLHGWYPPSDFPANVSKRQEERVRDAQLYPDQIVLRSQDQPFAFADLIHQSATLRVLGPA